MEYLYDSDLLTVDAQIIAQQCNCVTTSGKGLSQSIAEAFPHADFYSKRTRPSTPGTIEVRGGKGLRWVCAMYAQYHPGPPTERNHDDHNQRCAWFKKCLEKISRIKNLRHIAFPENIGCGLARGDWKKYYAMLYNFAEQNPHVRVSIVSKDSPPVEEFPVEEFPVEEVPVEETSSNGCQDADYNTMSLIDYTRGYMPKGWEKFFEEQLDPDMGTLTEISIYLEKEAKTNQIFPPLNLIYTSFHFMKPEEIKVVIIGQDPYHNQGQAMGIAFSVFKDIVPPPTLKNIHKEMIDTGIDVNDPDSGDLTPWCRQGVFLINTALTVRAHTPKSHSKKWTENFTPALLRWLNEECQPLVVILWGGDAHALGRYFGDHHHKISSAHPSPLSAFRGFFGSNPFNRANKYLKELGRLEVDWSL